MVLTNDKIGKRGEEAACRWLRKKDYKLVETNYENLPYGEIDIIARNGDYLVFVEVKTSQGTQTPFQPEKRIGFEKKRRLKNICQIYLSQNNIPLDSNWQIDVIAVALLGNKSAKIKHYKNAIRSR